MPLVKGKVWKKHSELNEERSISGVVQKLKGGSTREVLIICVKKPNPKGRGHLIAQSSRKVAKGAKIRRD